MESAFPRVSFAAALVALAASGCATGSTAPGEPPGSADVAPITTSTTAVEPVAPFALPDTTARPLTSADLAAMLPGGDAVVLTNSDLITRSLADTDDAAADVLGFRREVGVMTSIGTDSGTAHMWIDLLADADSAHGYLLDTAGDIIKRTGGTHAPEAAARAATEFPILVGEESIGLQIDLDSGAMSETAVLFRLGRLVVYTALEHPADTDLRVPLQYLAEGVQERAIATLAATPAATEVLEQPAYRFETTITVEAATETRLIERTGFIAGTDLRCRVRTVAPPGDVTVDLAVVDGVITYTSDDASASPTGSPRTAGAGDLAVRSMAAGCTSWPLDAAAAGLEALMGTTSTRHRINGINALGFSPEPATLGPILGSTLEGVVVDSFSFWVAEGTSWVVEIGFSVTGDAAVVAASLPPDWSALGTIRLVVRHRVFDLGAIDPAVVTAGFTPLP
jgi:hypothetical protein